MCIGPCPRWVAVAAFVWVILVAGLAVFGYLYPWSHTVYPIYAQAGRNWWIGRDLYAAEDTAYFRYSPLFAIAMTPLAQLPDTWSNGLWRIVNGLVYVWGLWSWARRVRVPDLSANQRAAVLLLVLPVSAASMYNGQANLLMLGILLLGLRAAADGHWNRAALWLAGATLIKGYPLALALLVAVYVPRRFAPRYAVALTVGLLLPFAAQDPAVVCRQYASWFGHLRDSTIIMRERLRSIDHLLAIYGYPLSPAAFLRLQLTAGVAVLGLCLLWNRRPTDLRQPLGTIFQLFAVWVVLFGPATEACTYAMIAPALAYELTEAFRQPTSWISRLLLVVSLFLMGPGTTDLVGSSLRNFANDHGSQPIGALLFLGCLMARWAASARTTKSAKHLADPSSLDVAA
jgi:hypothetical protein